jgi:hypothetical protein
VAGQDHPPQCAAGYRRVHFVVDRRVREIALVRGLSSGRVRDVIGPSTDRRTHRFPADSCSSVPRPSGWSNQPWPAAMPRSEAAPLRRPHGMLRPPSTAGHSEAAAHVIIAGRVPNYTTQAPEKRQLLAAQARWTDCFSRLVSREQARSVTGGVLAGQQCSAVGAGAPWRVKIRGRVRLGAWSGQGVEAGVRIVLVRRGRTPKSSVVHLSL